MDDGEVDYASHLLLNNPDMSSFGSFDEFLRNTRTCTHTHTCNPPGPDTVAHTHTCYHNHTQVFSAGESDEQEGDEQKRPARKMLGNREAVRKYREKKKAHAAYLEDEVKKLRHINQQLLRRLQGQAAVEAEILRLRSLLVDLRAKIDTELGVYPFQKVGNSAAFQCGNSQCMLGVGDLVGWERSCVPAVVDCQIIPSSNASLNLEPLNLEIAQGLDVGGNMLSSASL